MSVYLVLGLLALVAYLGYMSYRYMFNVVEGLIIFPLIAAAALAFYVHYNDALGAPLHQMPPAKFLYIKHLVTNGGKDIILWAETKQSGDRLYEFPYTRQREKALQEAQKGSQSGFPMTGTPIKGEGKSGSGDTFSFVVGDPIHGRSIPKN